MIIITGASDGLGQELAKQFVSVGKNVISLSRREASEATRTIITDLTQTKSIEAAVTEILSGQEPIEALINCAGVMSIQEIEKIDAEALANVIKTNIEAPILLTSGLMGRLKRDGADIVNVASTVGTKGYKDQAAYGASKWALRGFSANLQVELKDSPCRVISFCPGGFKSKIFEKATGFDNTGDGSQWMSATDLATCLRQLLELPKNVEVSEIIINRKTA